MPEREARENYSRAREGLGAAPELGG